MSEAAPFHADTEMQSAISALSAAEGLHASNLANAMRAVRNAAAEISNEEVRRWTACADKLWRAQHDLAFRHGAAWHAGALTTGLGSQLRRTWPSSIVGLALPCLLFGGAVIDRGFLLPTYWIAAVGADVVGRSFCLKRSRLLYPPENFNEPIDAGDAVVLALGRARTSGDWFATWPTIQQLGETDREIQARDQALKQASGAGRRVGFASVITACAGVAITKNDWACLGAGLLALFGIAFWLTSRSYAGALDQPPYPRDGSFERIRHNAHHESVLARTATDTPVDLSAINTHITKRMLRRRALRKALQQASRSERTLEDAQWKISILNAEREPSNN